jgi:hypothetical protein
VVHIWVRATLDYDDARAFEQQLKPGFRDRVALWDASFTMPYRVFRSRVRAIARENLARVDGAVCSSWEEIPDGALVLPCDDDDWFRPDAAAMAARSAGDGGVRWRSSFLEVPMHWRHRLGIWRRHVRGPRPEFLCTTNNYALFKTPDAHERLRNHLAASAWVGRRGPESVPFLRERLSLMNRTLASQTSLGRHGGAAIGRRVLLRKRDRYRRLYEQPLRGELAWAQPHADAMRALMAELELR